jgi:hypothetical protein
MTLDLSTIIYLALLAIVIGIVLRLGGVLVALFLTGISALVVIFALLLLADFLMGGTALEQLAHLLVPGIATLIATIAAWLKIKNPPIPGRYDG